MMFLFFVHLPYMLQLYVTRPVITEGHVPVPITASARMDMQGEHVKQVELSFF